MEKLLAEYLGWEYKPFGGEVLKYGWYKPCIEKNSVGGFTYVCRNHKQLKLHLSLEDVFSAVEKVEKEQLFFGYSWKHNGKLTWNNSRLVFSMFNGKIDFCLERQLDPDKTIVEKHLDYTTLKQDLIEMICEVLKYLENERV